MGASTLVNSQYASTHLILAIKIHQDIRSQSTHLIQNNTDLDQTLDTSVLITQDTNLQDSTNTGQDLLSINQDSLSISRDHPSSSISQGLNIIRRIKYLLGINLCPKCQFILQIKLMILDSDLHLNNRCNNSNSNIIALMSLRSLSPSTTTSSNKSSISKRP
jgi:hypothetical protein